MENRMLSRTVPQIRLGMLTPSSNTALEPLTQAMLNPVASHVSAHFSRFQVTQIALDSAANQQFQHDPILAAADLLADARCSAIAWNGTSASWLGFERDRELCEAITGRTGSPSTSAILALNCWLARRDITRIGLVTPYTADVQERIIANYASIGIDVATEVHSGLRDNFSFAALSEAEIAQMCREAANGVEAVAVICTNMRGPMVAATLEEQLGIPILDSIAVTLWGSLVAAGVQTAPLGRYGSVFTG